MNEAIEKNKPEIITNLKEKFEEISRNETARFALAKYYRSIYRWLGIPSAIISALVSSSLFYLIQNQASERIKLLLACLSAIVAILSAIQLFLQPQTLAESNRICGNELFALREKLKDSIKTPNAYSYNQLKKLQAEITEGYISASKNAPEIPARFWRKYCEKKDDNSL